MTLSDGTVARLLQRETEVFAGRFEIVGEAGAGGMGAVYKAVDGETGDLVALKVLRLDTASDGLERFRREATILERLEHPAIVRYVAHGANDEGEPWLAMEWLEGVTLSERLRRQPPLTLGDALAIGHQVATALAAAHARGVVHRDLKPGNIVLAGGSARDAKVIDFGIARAVAGASAEDLTRTGQIVGTPGYMAPEQLRGARDVDGRADLFALGCVIYRMVGGQPAFGGDDLISVIAKIAMDSPVALRRLRPGIPPPLDRLVRSLLEKSPADRPSDASAVAGELRLLIADLEAQHVDLPLTPNSVEHDPTVPDGRARTEARSEARTGPTRPTKSARVAAIAGVIASVVFAGAMAALGPAWSERADERHASAAPSSQPFAWAPPTASDPGPVSQVPEAESLYREAVRAWKDGATPLAIAGMRRATEIDPRLGAGHLRLAIWKMARRDPEARELYQTALRQRALLSADDRALLDAAEPLVRQPWDLAAWSARLEALSRARPADTELLLYLGEALHARLEFAEAIEVFDRALAKDPDLLAAFIGRGEAFAMLGDVAAQREAYEACLRRRNASAECLSRKVKVRARMGECEAMREEARALAASAPSLEEGRELLANALLATGDTGPALQETLAQRWAMAPEASRRAVELQDRFALATLSGDLEHAIQITVEWSDAVKSRQDQYSRGLPILRRARLLEETGDGARARDEAAAFLSLLAALPDAIGGDMSIHFVGVVARNGGLEREAFEERRRAWLERHKKKWKNAGRRMDDEYAWIAWSTAYGGEVRTEADAKQALAAMPTSRLLTVESGRWPAMDLNVGRVLALTGKSAQALVPLRRAASACERLDDPTRTVTAQYYLGLALEDTGDVEGARTAYGAVISAWGQAKPRSATAALARAGLERLAAR